jgi:hypothetical protein
LTVETATGLSFASGGDFYDHILNKFFRPFVADTVINPNTLFTRLRRDTTRVEGKSVVFPIHTGRNEGVGAIGAGGDLPDPQAQAYDNYEFPVKFNYGRIKFDGISQHASKTSVASWLRAVNSEAKGLARDMKRDKQRQAWNDGSGRLCEIAAAGEAVNETTISCRINQGWESPTVCNMAPTHFLRAGMVIAIIEDAAGTGVPVGDGTDTIRHIDTILTVADTTDFTIAATGLDEAVIGGAWIVRCANADNKGSATTEGLAQTGYQNECMGMSGIFMDTDPLDGTSGGFQGIDSDDAAKSWHRANMINSGSGTTALTNLLMDQAWTRSIEIGEVQPTAIYGSFAMVREYANLFTNASGPRRYVNVMAYDGGYDALEYNGAPVIADRDCPNNRFFFVYEPDLVVDVLADPQWMDEDGSIYHRMDDKDAYQATMYCHETLSSEVRDHQTLLVEITENT